MFKEFKTKQPYLIRFEGYRVSLTVEVQLLTREGSEIFSRSYTGSGKERFVSVLRDDVGAFAFRRATRVAIKEVVDQAAGDIAAVLRR